MSSVFVFSESVYSLTRFSKKLGFPSILISSMKSNGLDELHLVTVQLQKQSMGTEYVRYYLEHLNALALALAMTLPLPVNKNHEGRRTELARFETIFFTYLL
jgi:hypothetical protein